MTENIISEYPIQPEHASKRPNDQPQKTSFSLSNYIKTNVNQVAVLAVLIGLLALLFPFMNVFSTRVMPIGEPVNLWHFFPNQTLKWGWWVLLAWLGVLIASALPITKATGCLKPILLTFFVSFCALLLIAISSYETVSLVKTELSSVSFSIGAWLSVLAIYIAIFSVYQQSPRLVVVPIIVILLFSLIAPFEHWGIYKEYRAAPDAFKTELKQHILMVLSALPLIIVIGTALGFIATKKSWLEEIILSLNGFVQTIPSIALYGLLLPLLSFFGKNITVGYSLILGVIMAIAIMGLLFLARIRSDFIYFKLLAWLLTGLSVLFFLPILTNFIFQTFSDPTMWLTTLHYTATWESLGLRGLGTTPALIALVLYGVFPLVVNVHSSIQNIPTELTNAAKGIGLSPAQVFWKVQFPLILPFFIDGVRLSCLMLISLTTIAVIVNAGGLGVFLMRGTEQSVPDLILLGCIPTVILALIIDVILRLVQNIITPKGLKYDSFK